MRFAKNVAIALDYQVTPANACGGVWVDERQGFVPVALSSECDDGQGGTIWEYSEANPTTGELVRGEDGQDVIRAAMIHAPVGQTVAAWHIRYEAPVDYSERHRTVAGRGTFWRWEPVTEASPLILPRHSLPRPPARGYLGVRPGDTFQIGAAPKRKDEKLKDYGLFVLAVFCGAPFRQEYEQMVSPPDEDLILM